MSDNGNGKIVNAPLPGKIVEVNVKSGDAVKRGDQMLVIEAMKMYNQILSPYNGSVETIHVAVGQNIDTGEGLVVIVEN